MELIVKIGGDQQGLKDTVDKMVKEFKTANVSMPVSWQPHQNAMQQYGGILQSATGSGGGFSKFKDELSEISPALGGFAGKIAGLAGPLALVGAAFGAASLAVKTGIDTVKEAMATAREARITGLSATMVKNVQSVGGEDSMMMIKRFMASAGGFLAGDKSAKEAFGELGVNPEGMTSDALLTAVKKSFAGMTDPAKRNRIAKELFGRGSFDVTEMLSKLNTESDSLENADVQRLAQVGGKWKKAWRTFSREAEKTRTELTSALASGLGAGEGGQSLESQQIGMGGEADVARKKAAEDAVKAEAEYKKAAFARLDPSMKLGYLMNNTLPEAQARLAAMRPGTAERFGALNEVEQAQHDIRELEAELLKARQKKPEKETREEKPLSFQADALAQAGLFSGSSLLFNPNFTIQQEQLNVLREINTNIGSKRSLFEP